MSARFAKQMVGRSTQVRRELAGEDHFDIAAVLRQHLQRQEQLAARRIIGQHRDHPQEALREAGVARQMIDCRRRRATGDVRGQRNSTDEVSFR